MKDLMRDLQVVIFYEASIRTLEELGIKEEYEVECQKALKEIAERNERIAEDIAKDLERETTLYMFSRASLAIESSRPDRFILSAFGWADSEKGFDYWYEMTKKFCESHPLVGTEDNEEDSIKCDKCGSTNVSVGSFGDRTGVTCKDCGETRLLVD
ncbi:hypothetical protein [Arcobacter cloacae]|uniref:Uncharacterized protein n=1 Tax=Arcobacter cloacae TaxID=1054034 RepID=A0A4Q0ZEK8_9BACT|nr:hypothetical protein [Arcobacter cloacae]RXJ84759.1 hypothetical protein CRU90_05225 [Arcobacter cloacae]